MMKIEKQVIEYDAKPKNNEKPIVWNWKKAPMLLSHSIRATIKEILQMSKSIDAININVIGNPATGKSEVTRLVSHLGHKMAKEMGLPPFAVREFDKQNLLNFKETLASLTPSNYFLGFHDVSFLGASASKQQIETVKQATTEIRHLPGGKDVKIVSVKNFHYTLGFDKYLRQSDFTYFTSVGSSEMDNMEKIVGTKYMPLVHRFRKMQQKATITGKFSFQLKRDAKPFVYGYRNPFIPLLFWNNDTLRIVVSPTRHWVDPICNTCTEFSAHEKFETEVPLEQFIKESEHKLDKSRFKQAVRQKLLENGINVYPNEIASAKKYLERALEKKTISLEEIATYYGMKPANTKLRKKLDGVLS